MDGGKQGFVTFSFPNTFAMSPSRSAGVSAQLAPPPVASPTPPALEVEEVQAPAAGTRKAKVLYDYDAADTSELSLLADEVSARVWLPLVVSLLAAPSAKFGTSMHAVQQQ